MESSTCNHLNISFIKPDTQKRLQCRHCHLTITEAELDKSFCPECYESTGKKNYDFAPLISDASEKILYRCESCGIIIEC